MSSYQDCMLLKRLSYYKNDDEGRVRGSEVANAICKDGYDNFIQFLPDVPTPAICEPLSTERSPLTHNKLRQFVTEFNLELFGIPRGNRVAILLPNGPELAVCLVATLSKWCVAPINPTNTIAEIESELKSTKAKALIIIAGLSINDAVIAVAKALSIGVIVITKSGGISGLFTLASLLPVQSLKAGYDNVKPVAGTVTGTSTHPEIVLLLHTSGTSGIKKLVPYTLDMILVGVGCIVSSWKLSPNDICLNMMPLFHIGGIMRNILSPLLSGGSVICCSGFDPLLFWDVLYAQKITWYYAAPTMHQAILLQSEQRIKPLPIDSVRFIANAAGGLLPVLAVNLRNTFKCVILTSYGMTECMPISSPPQSYNLDPTGTSGIAVGPEILIANEDMKACKLLESGSILIKGFPCFCGYENDDSANKDAFVTIDGSVYFDTGDIGYLDSADYLFISGRSKEIINRGGETISPFEIEEAVQQHPHIKEVLSFSAPHLEFQETIGVAVVTKTNYPRIDIYSLHKFLDNKLHRAKWPQVIVFLDVLPKNAANKLLRIRFAERTGIPNVDEESSQLSRLYEGSCCPVGSPLTVPIGISKVRTSCTEIEVFLMSQLEVEDVCVVQLDLPFHQDAFVAFVVLKNEADTALITKLQVLCKEQLHSYLSPFAIHKRKSFPQKDGLIDRDALKAIALRMFNERSVVAPRTAIETQMELVWREQLNAINVVSVVESFFDLGGDSLKAGQLISALRKELRVHLSVADLFTAPTIAALSHKVASMKTIGSPRRYEKAKRSSEKVSLNNDNNEYKETYISWDNSTYLHNTSFACMVTQSLPILLFFPLRSIMLWFLVATPWVFLMSRGMGRFHALLCAMVISRVSIGLFVPLIGIMAKWMIIGRYKPGRYPLWGTMYLKWWIVEQIVNVMGKGYFRDDLPIIGPNLVRLYYVMMGARIGKNVKIHKDASIGTCADLLEIGDDVLIDKATVRPMTLEGGHFMLLPIKISSNCCVGSKSTIAAGSVILSDVSIGPLSSSHEKEEAKYCYRDYCRPGFVSPPAYLVVFVGIPILLLVTCIGLIPWYIGLKIMVSNAKVEGWYQYDIKNLRHAFIWWITPQRLFYYFLIRIIRRCLVPPVRLTVIILIKRLLIGKFVPMNAMAKSEPWNIFRYWLMSRLLPGSNLSGVSKLVGTHYEIISIIYRLLGAKIGKHVYWPGSGLEIVEYDLLEIGNDVVFGSRSMVMTSTATRSAKVVFEDGVMIADRCVILPGVVVKRGAVLGSGSLASENLQVPVGSVYVGSANGTCVNASPEDLSYNVKDTITPFGRAFYSGKASYRVLSLPVIVIYNTVWQAICTCFRHCPTVLSLILCNCILKLDKVAYSEFEIFKFTMIAFAPVSLALCVLSLSIDIAAKWMLLGRRKQGAYPWDESDYCQRWQMYLTIQEIRRSERKKNGFLDMLQGSVYLCWYFKALGCNIGKNVCLYPNGADPMMTEPDLVTINDNACIDEASVIAHINTRGVFRLNPLYIGDGAVLKSSTRLLSGATMEKYSMLLEHTLVLSGESVDVGSVWQGWPSRSQKSLTLHKLETSRILDAEASQYHNIAAADAKGKSLFEKSPENFPFDKVYDGDVSISGSRRNRRGSSDAKGVYMEVAKDSTKESQPLLITGSFMKTYGGGSYEMA